MTTKELYIQLASGSVSVSTALALAIVSAPLSEDELVWVQSELNGYRGKENVPDYRQLDCEIKARVQNMYNGGINDVRITGAHLKGLDSLLRKNFGLSIFKIYVGQGVESIEQQINGHGVGDIIMEFEGGPAQELIDSLKDQERTYNFVTLSVFQSTPLAYLQNALSVIKSNLMAILVKHIKETNNGHLPFSEVNRNKKVIFISYCWESEDHKQWVRKLADDLGLFFDVLIDQEVPYGIELSYFMEQAIAKSDKVLIIVTPQYKYKADNRTRGVGYETSLITEDLVTDQNRIKFIPVIRIGSKEESYPRYLGSRKGVDMTDDTKYAAVFEDLKRNLLEY